jgi:hypothetical protein
MVDNIVDLEFDIGGNFGEVEVVVAVGFYRSCYRIRVRMNHGEYYCSSLEYKTFCYLFIYYKFIHKLYI